METKPYKIVLEKGEAKRNFFELTEEEVTEVGKRIFEKVRSVAAKFGQTPVTIDSIKSSEPKSR